MKVVGDVLRSIDRSHLFEFLRFCAVGAIGFSVDASMLLLGIRAGGNPIEVRLLSFSVAVLVTYEMNRRWAFRERSKRSFVAAFFSYLGVQGLGFICNFGVYTSLYLGLPTPYNKPVLCLVVASGLALLVNYAGASVWVFRQRVDRSADVCK